MTDPAAYSSRQQQHQSATAVKFSGQRSTQLQQLATELRGTWGWCKARYAVLFQIRTFPPEPEDEAHIGPTATYDEVIYPGFQHDITALQIQGYNISYNR